MYAGAFYFLLGNLHPRYRASTNNIQLVSLFKSSFISKYGIDLLLKPFIEDVKKLESVSFKYQVLSFHN